MGNQNNIGFDLLLRSIWKDLLQTELTNIFFFKLFYWIFIFPEVTNIFFYQIIVWIVVLEWIFHSVFFGHCHLKIFWMILNLPLQISLFVKKYLNIKNIVNYLQCKNITKYWMIDWTYKWPYNNFQSISPLGRCFL